MKIIFGNKRVEHIPSACPDIEIRLTESVPYVHMTIGFDLFYLAPDAALDLADYLSEAAKIIKEKRQNAPTN